MRIVVVLPSVLGQPGPGGLLEQRGDRHLLHEGAAQYGGHPPDRNSRYHGPHAPPSKSRRPRGLVIRVAWLPVERAGSVGYARASGLREPAGGQCPGLVDVDAHLRHEVIDRDELDRSPQPDGEVHRHVRPVQVQVVAVESVGLHGAVAAVEGGITADRDRRGPALVPRPVRGERGQPARVDAVGRDGGVRRGLQVRGGKAERAAPLLSPHHHALHPRR